MAYSPQHRCSKRGHAMTTFRYVRGTGFYVCFGGGLGVGFTLSAGYSSLTWFGILQSFDLSEFLSSTEP